VIYVIKMNKYIFWMSKKNIGVCDINDWGTYSKENNLKPTTISILSCSDQYIDELMKLCKTNLREFQKQVLKEIADDLYKILMN